MGLYDDRHAAADDYDSEGNYLVGREGHMGFFDDHNDPGTAYCAGGGHDVVGADQGDRQSFIKGMTEVGEALASHLAATMLDARHAQRNTRAEVRAEVARLRGEADALLARIGRRAEELKFLEELPDADPFPDGTVLRFTKQFDDQGYTYLALRAGGTWYLTVRRGAVMQWPDLIEFMAQGSRPVNLETLASSGKPLPWQFGEDDHPV